MLAHCMSASNVSNPPARDVQALPARRPFLKADRQLSGG